MRLGLKVGMAAMMFTVAAALPVVSPAASPARTQARDWTTTISRSPSGAYVLGNPAAPVKLVEYLSYTCSHCAHFALEGLGPLKANYIRPGRVSIEFRHALRDPYDFVSALLARCAGPAAYLATSEAIFAAQPQWLTRASDVQPTPGQSRTATVRAVGLDVVARARGISTARQTACLENPAEAKVLSDMAAEAWQQRQIHGTPAFMINGTIVDGAADWARLEPAIRDALSRRRPN